MRAVFALVLIVGMGLAGVAVYMIQGYMADLEGALRNEQAFNAKAGPPEPWCNMPGPISPLNSAPNRWDNDNDASQERV